MMIGAAAPPVTTDAAIVSAAAVRIRSAITVIFAADFARALTRRIFMSAAAFASASS